MKSKTLLALLAAGVILSACDKEPRQGEGTLRVALSGVDAGVTVEATRALDITAPATADFSLRITNGDESFDESWPSIDQYPGKGYMLVIGDYKAAALYGSLDAEGFDKPCFGVEKNFTIYNEVTTTVEMEASLLNMVVTVDYTEAFLEYFAKGFAVTVTSGAGNEFAFDRETGGKLFIAPANFGVKIDYTRPNGNTGTENLDVTQNIGARKHFDITLDVNGGEVGGAAITVSFDDTMETIPLDIETGEND